MPRKRSNGKRVRGGSTGRHPASSRPVTPEGTRGEQAALAEAVRLLTGTLDLAVVLQRLTELLRARLNVDVVRIWLREAQGEFRLKAQAGVTRKAEEYRIRFGPGEGLVGWIIAHRAPMTLSDLVGDPRFKNRDWAKAEGLISFLGVPLILEDAPVGVLAAMSRERRVFTPEEVALAELLAVPAAVAIRNARLYESAREQAGELVALHQVGHKLVSMLDLQTVLEAIADSALNLIGAQRCAVFELDPRDQRLHARASRGMRADQPFMPLKLGQGAAGSAALLRQPVFSPDIHQHPLPMYDEPSAETEMVLRDVVRQRQYRAIMAVPLVSKDTVMGTIDIYWDQPHAYDEREVRLLTALAQQAAVVIENARLFEAVRRSATERSALLETMAAINSDLSPDVVLQLIIDKAVEVIGAEKGSLFVFDQASQTLELTASHGLSPQATLVLKIGEGVGGKAILWKRAVAVPDVEADTQYDIRKEFARQEGIRALLVVPLLTNDQAVGAIAVCRTAPYNFSPQEIEHITLFANQAAVALHNSALINELRTALADLKTAQEHLVRGETLRAMGEMTAGAAHHLNNLLAVVLGRVQLLLSRIQEPDARHALEIVERMALEAAEVVRRVREFTRGQPVTEMVPVDLNQLAREVLELTRPRWQDQAQVREVSIEAELELGEIPRVVGEPAPLREALLNLVLNAIEALPQGGRITAKTWASPQGVHCSITDTGVGMDEPAQQRAMEPFFTTKGPRSTGLGLSVSYGIVKRHGGELAVESREGQGTTVTLCLPLAPPLSGAAPAHAPASTSRGRLNILVIDDEDQVRAVLAEMLATLGHTVVQAAGGPVGLRLLTAGEPIDLVLTDLGMPEMTGWEVARIVKGRWPHLPVGLLTGWGEKPQTTPEECNGVDFVIAKPVSLEALREAISRSAPSL
ncbi:MAG: GAF domain-containing protein [Candidatus Rokubacteria bacterium]|nr:GAF domain-containing protein [Candidatus Rokubacteria bacterium]